MSDPTTQPAQSGVETIAAAREAADEAFVAAENAVAAARRDAASTRLILASWVNETVRDSPVARDVEAWNFLTGPALTDLERRLSAAE